MCKGMEDWLEERENQGIERGIKALIETCREFGSSREDTLLKVEGKFSLSREQAEAHLVKYWE